MTANQTLNEVVQLTFVMPAMEGCGALYLVDDFNGWDPTAHPMQRNDDGSWSLTLELEPGSVYQYCYCTGDGVWHNDPAADGYVANPFGSENSVVRT